MNDKIFVQNVYPNAVAYQIDLKFYIVADKQAQYWQWLSKDYYYECYACENAAKNIQRTMLQKLEA